MPLAITNAKFHGMLSINVFWTHPPHGGARRAPCEKCWLEVLNCYAGNVCAKFGCDGGNGAGGSVVTDRRTDGLTKSLPHGGARRAACEKCWVEVLNCYPGNVCAKFGCDRANGAGD